MTVQELAPDELHDELPDEVQDEPGAEVGDVVASWEGPAWADRSETDENVVIYVRRLGTVTDVDGREFPLLLVQRDEVRPSPDVVAIDRQPAYAAIENLRLDMAAVEGLSQLLASALRLAGGRRSALERDSLPV